MAEILTFSPLKKDLKKRRRKKVFYGSFCRSNFYNFFFRKFEKLNISAIYKSIVTFFSESSLGIYIQVL